MTWANALSAVALRFMAFAGRVSARISGRRAISGIVGNTSRKPSQDALRLLERREILMHDRQTLRRQHRARSSCDAELRAITHKLLGARCD
jgi:hypothetical protein